MASAATRRAARLGAPSLLQRREESRGLKEFALVSTRSSLQLEGRQPAARPGAARGKEMKKCSDVEMPADALHSKRDLEKP